MQSCWQRSLRIHVVGPDPSRSLLECGSHHQSDHTLIRSGHTDHAAPISRPAQGVATAVARGSLSGLLGFGLILLGLVLKLRQEEQLLNTQFGSAYDAYKKDVPALVPRLW